MFCCLCCQIIDYVWKHKTNEKNIAQKPSDWKASGIRKEAVSFLCEASWGLKIGFIFFRYIKLNVIFLPEDSIFHHGSDPKLHVFHWL